MKEEALGHATLSYWRGLGEDELTICAWCHARRDLAHRLSYTVLFEFTVSNSKVTPSVVQTQEELDVFRTHLIFID
jgi:hypothetical protein